MLLPHPFFLSHPGVFARSDLLSWIAKFRPGACRPQNLPSGRRSLPRLTRTNQTQSVRTETKRHAENLKLDSRRVSAADLAMLRPAGALNCPLKRPPHPTMRVGGAPKLDVGQCLFEYLCYRTDAAAPDCEGMSSAFHPSYRGHNSGGSACE